MPNESNGASLKLLGLKGNTRKGLALPLLASLTIGNFVLYMDSVAVQEPGFIDVKMWMLEITFFISRIICSGNTMIRKPRKYLYLTEKNLNKHYVPGTIPKLGDLKVQLDVAFKARRIVVKFAEA